jgi:hypothetical protein
MIYLMMSLDILSCETIVHGRGVDGPAVRVGGLCRIEPLFESFNSV